MRFYNCPTDTIFIDGVDLNELSIDGHLSRIVLVGSEPEFFDESIRYNVIPNLIRYDNKLFGRSVCLNVLPASAN